MRYGDLVKVNAIRQNSQGGEHYVADVIYSRMVYDLDASDQKSQECIRQAELQNGPTVAFICRALAAGNDLLRGNISGWASKLAQLKSSSGEFIAGTSLPVSDVLDDVEDYARWSHISGTSTLSLPHGSYRLPFKHVFMPNRTSEVAGVFVDAKVNGRPISLFFDTGAASTYLYEPDARAAKVLLQSGWTPVTGTTGADSASSLGIANQIQLGDITLRHWPIVALKGARLGAIGLDVMSRLGPMLITHDGVQLLSADASAIPCEQPIVLASPLTGFGGGLRFPVTIDGQPEFAALDTGASNYLMKVGAAEGEMESSKKKDIQTANGVTTVTYAEKRVSLIAGPIRSAVTAQIFAGHKLDFMYSLGSDFLKDANVFIDFSSHRACILPKEGGAADASTNHRDVSQSK
ncbi:hypothetical protein GCM10009552_07960 [Rothia nasimurium]|uniref:Peptidase A2 domain-containing protein n=1 Tax=Luteibacter anthropi TaxID=564369 RepID=A0A7X5U7S9_9GAMM|nr:retroviral-like aspartic protease family protein [Luteibacter anthropi]NII05382.1 hypothetical protein [Luteibacter anthropi]